jgi:hypothetical protein
MISAMRMMLRDDLMTEDKRAAGVGSMLDAEFFDFAISANTTLLS